MALESIWSMLATFGRGGQGGGEAGMSGEVVRIPGESLRCQISPSVNGGRAGKLVNTEIDADISFIACFHRFSTATLFGFASPLRNISEP
jgi:hypothetical protein